MKDNIPETLFRLHSERLYTWSRKETMVYTISVIMTQVEYKDTLRKDGWVVVEHELSGRCDNILSTEARL